MGSRANFVVIRNGIATAYYDHWAALGCLLSFAGGPDEASKALEAMEQTNQLMEWAWAEGGYLVDFDTHNAITFGFLDSSQEMGEESATKTDELYSAFERGPLDFLQFIAPHWKGWLLQWDDRGVDAFSDYLQRRNIPTIMCQPASHPPNSEFAECQA